MFEEFINKKYTYAIIGASNNKEKYGHRVLKDLKNAGYKVIPVNLHEDEISGLKSYKNLSSFPGEINIAVFVIPPTATLEVLKEVKEIGIKKVWMQPGSESDEAINYCKDNNIECVYNACIMVQRVAGVGNN